jgi:hypothetical protein
MIRVYVSSRPGWDGRLLVQRKLTITIDEEIYAALHQQVGRGHISAFIEKLVRPHVYTDAALEEGYRALVADEEAEREAFEWIEGVMTDLEVDE